jgi:hypothetical protein
MINEILKMYKELKLGGNEICKTCKIENIKVKSGISRPISPWHIGKRFKDDFYKVMFVGKNARGDDDNKRSDVIDATIFGKKALLNPFSAFWSYTGEIACRLYGPNLKDAIESIAMANLIKCNNAMDDEGRNHDGTSVDYTTPLMKENCLNKMKVFWKEVDILKPKHIILYTHHDYDGYLEKFPNFSENEITEKDFTCKVGAKNIKWWDKELCRDGTLSMRVLVTSHPERKKKKEFVDKIISWIKKKM